MLALYRGMLAYRRPTVKRSIHDVTQQTYEHDQMQGRTQDLKKEGAQGLPLIFFGQFIGFLK